MSEPNDVRYREIQAEDLAQQEDLLYVSLWDAPDEPRRPRSVLQHSRARLYLDDWGREGDAGFIAEAGELAVGAAWCRHKFAVVKEHAGLPELILAVLPDWEGQGIGSELMRRLIAQVRTTEGGLRLGVHPKNHRARSLYETFGFEAFAHPENGYIQMALLFEPRD